MQRELDWARGADRENDMLTTEALALTASGRLASARQLFDRSWAASQSGGLNDDAAYSMAREALAEADFGNYEQARARASAALKLGHGMDAEETAAEAFALAGDVQRALALVEDLRSRFHGHTVLNQASIPSTMAAIELQRQNPSKAIELLRQAEPFDLSEFGGLSPVYIRGQAYLRAGRGKDAVEQFQRIVDHPGVDVTSQRHNLAQFGLARAFVLAGNVSQARAAYDHFFSLWSSADDVPVLRVAKQEYEKLR
jgi:eukaryotic-like serine/threonine-protein kinase